MLRWKDIPGYREAVKRENDIRDAAFLNLTADICGVKIRQMTPRDFLILDGIGNPVVNNGLPTPAQLAEFLWLLSPEYKTDAKFRRFLFGLRIRRINYIEAVRKCWKYVEATFQDSPAGSGQASLPYVGWCAHIVHEIAINYGWDREDIFNLPLKELFQYLRCIRRHHNPQSPVHNPSDKIRGDFIRRLALKNERQKLVNILKRRAAN